MTWDDVLTAITPWEQRSGRWYKREDLCAPEGPGGINGSKLRQCLHLVSRAADRGAPGVVSGASVLSPQLAMTAGVAAQVGVPCRLVIGGTTAAQAARRRSVAVALDYGADLEVLPVGYNPALQAAVRRLADRDGWYEVRYGIAPDPDPESVTAFHLVGAAQVANTPPEVRHLVVPMGSANSTISILAGLAMHPTQVERVTLVGIGPNRQAYLAERLAVVLGEVGVRPWSGRVDHHDLHTAGIVSYGQRRPARLDGIDFHPTYEGKVVRWLLTRSDVAPGFLHGDGATALWIVGSEVR